MRNIGVLDFNTGEIQEIKDGDSLRITRKESKDLLKETIAINDKETFIKFYTNIIEDLVNENLTSAEWNTILVCLKHLNYYSGSIAYENNGNFLTPQDFVKHSKLSERTVLRSINKLVSSKILHKGRTGKEYQLFANPYIFMKGARINKTLVDMFKKSKWSK